MIKALLNWKHLTHCITKSSGVINQRGHYNISVSVLIKKRSVPEACGRYLQGANICSNILFNCRKKVYYECTRCRLANPEGVLTTEKARQKTWRGPKGRDFDWKLAALDSNKYLEPLIHALKQIVECVRSWYHIWHYTNICLCMRDWEKLKRKGKLMYIDKDAAEI